MTTNDSLLRPYFGYIGSKSGMRDDLISRMTLEAYTSFSEVFAGGVGLYLGKRKARFNTLNDIDPDVCNVHVAVSAAPERVMKEMSMLRPCRATFNRLRELRGTAAWHDLDDAQRAAYFIYLGKNSVNSNFRSFSNSGKSRSTFNPHYDLRPYSAKFDRVTFENLDWRELLNRLVFKPKEVTLFAYLDPPYVTSDSEKHYRFNFNFVEHMMLARTLAKINELNDGERRNVKLMVSYDDDAGGFIRSLYRPEHGWWLETIDVRYGSEHRANRCRSELLIMNYDPASVRSDGALTGAKVQTGGTS